MKQNSCKTTFLRARSYYFKETLNKALLVYPNTNLEFKFWDFPGGTVVKNLPANAGDMGLSPGPGRSHMPRSN